jgi:ribosomal RNA assembly protein
MIKIHALVLRRILQAKSEIEDKLNVKINNKGKLLEISGAPEDEFIAEKIVQALNFGFPIDIALLLTEEYYLFEQVNIKSTSRTSNLERVRGRIIGTQGKTLKTLSHVSNCHFELKDNEVGIIGTAEQIPAARQAILSLIKGSKQSNVYSYLEKHHVSEVVDYGIKEPKKKDKK